MKKILSLLILGIFLISLISAFSICVDKTLPSAPSNLVLVASGNNIQLSWTAATDIPDCSGIDYYDIYRGKDGGNLSLINYSEDTNYLDTGLSYGTYTYIIHAWDLAGHNEGTGISNSITISAPGENGDNGNGNGGGGGGRGDNDISYWQCEEWSECINGTHERVCVDLEKLQSDKIETKECSADFVPTGNGETTQEEPLQEGFFSRITGAVVGGVTNFAKSGTGTVTLIVLIGLLTTFIVVRRYRLRKESKAPKDEDIPLTEDTSSIE